MRFSFTVHQKDAIDAGIPNGNCLLVFEIVASANKWANEHEGGYWWTARQAISAELELWKLKPDTVYRHLKTLQELGLIDYKKHGKKDLTKLTKKGQKFFGNSPESTMSEIDPNHYVGNRSEFTMSEIDPDSENSEIDPSKFGNRSELELGNRSDISLTTSNTSPLQNDHGGAPQSGYQKKHEFEARNSDSKSLEKFLKIYPKSPSTKRAANYQWFRDRGGWNCESIADQILTALETQISTCHEYSNSTYVKKPEAYLEHEKWRDKIVREGKAPVESKPTSKPTCKGCGGEPLLGADQCNDCFEKQAQAQLATQTGATA